MVANTSELTKELIDQNLLIFQRYQVDAKNIKCLLTSEGNMKPCSKLLAFKKIIKDYRFSN
jgi:hypothetical protein